MRILGTVVRQLRRDPGFSMGIIVPLSLALTAALSMFAIVNQLLLRPPDGVARPADLFRVKPVSTRNAAGRSVSLAEFMYLRDAMPNGVQLTASAWRDADLSFGGQVDRVQVELVASNYFDVLGVRPMLGRLLAKGDEVGFDAAPVAVLSKAYWEESRGADTSIIGRSVRINGVAYTVLGIVGGNFHGLEIKAPALWVPAGRIIDFGIGPASARSRTYLWLTLFGRHRPDIGLRRVTTIVAMTRRRDTEGTRTLASRGMTRIPLAATRLADAGGGLVSPNKIALWLLALSLTLLVAACLNAGVLLVARVRRQERALATKRALGARPGRLVLEVLLESAFLAGVAAVLAAAIVPVVLRVLGGITGLVAPMRDPRVVTFGAIAVLLVCAIAAAVPALMLVRRQASGLDHLMRGGSASIGSRPIRALLTGQAAVVLLLMVFAGDLIHAVDAATSLDLGVDSDHLAVVNIAWSHDPRRNQFMVAARDRLAAIPDVRAAVMSFVAPFFGGSLSRSLQAPARPGTAATALNVDGNIVEPGYFGAIGMRLLEGRDFTRNDRSGAPQVAIVNRAFAQAYFGSDRAFGRCITAAGVPANTCTLRIVGVVTDAQARTVLGPIAPEVFTPVAQAPGFPLTVPLLVVVRTTRKADEVSGELRATLRDLQAPSAIQIETVDGLISSQVAPWRRAAFIANAFALVALGIGAFGIYATTTSFVVWRRREYAIRVALGATPTRLRIGMVAERVFDALIGAAGGVVGSVWILPQVGEALHLPDHGFGPPIAASAAILLALVIGVTSIALQGQEAFDPGKVLQYG